MVKTVQENRFYFLLLAAFILIGGIYLWHSEKVDAILFCSDNRSAMLNETFKMVTHLGEAPAYLLIGMAALLVRFRYGLLVWLTGVIVLGMSFGLKSYFAIDRPMAFFTKQNLLDKINFIEGIQVHSGATSFPSGHSMAAFALYSLLVFLLPSQKKYAAILFTMALLVGFSRIYLVQHFWPDVYVGGIVGALLAMVVYAIQVKFPISSENWLDKSLMKRTPKSRIPQP